eukprot:2118908-Pyramimonas_sp.AAC.1
MAQDLEWAAPWVLKQYETQKHVIGWLEAPMGSSVVYDPAKRKARTVKAVKAVKPPPKKKAKKGSNSGSTAVPEEEIELLVEAKAGVERREKKWLDDLAGVVASPLKLLPTGPEIIKTEPIRKLFRVGLQFAFTGEVSFNGKSFTAWSKLRKELRDECITINADKFKAVHRAAAGAASGSSPSTAAAEGDDIAEFVAKQPGEDEEQKLSPTTAAAYPSQFSKWLTVPEFVIRMSKFASENDLDDPREHLALIGLTEHVYGVSPSTPYPLPPSPSASFLSPPSHPPPLLARRRPTSSSSSLPHPASSPS